MSSFQEKVITLNFILMFSENIAIKKKLISWKCPQCTVKGHQC